VITDFHGIQGFLKNSLVVAAFWTRVFNELLSASNKHNDSIGGLQHINISREWETTSERKIEEIKWKERRNRKKKENKVENNRKKR